MASLHRMTGVVLIVVIGASLGTTTAYGQKGGKSKGGNGDTPLANPAFVYQDETDGGLFLLSANGKQSIRLTRNGKTLDQGATWSPDFDEQAPGHQGWIAFFRQHDSRYIWGDLFIVPSDASGPPVLIRSYTDFAAPPPDRIEKTFSWSPDGSCIIYVGGGYAWAVRVLTGQVERLPIFVPEGIDSPSFSPDMDLESDGYQGMIAYRGSDDILVCPAEVDGIGAIHIGPSVNLTQTSDTFERQPVWSPDGDYLAYFRSRMGAEIGAGNYRISVMELASGNQWDVIGTHSSQIRPTWSPDGDFIAFSDAREVNGKWTKDIFYTSPWILGMLVNVTNTDSPRSLEVEPKWNPSWMSELP